MFCAIDKEQIRDFRARVFGELYKRADASKKPLDVDKFINYFKGKLLEASKDEAGNIDEVWANTFVALIPEILLRASGSPDLMEIMPENMKTLRSLVSSFSDPVNGYDNVVKYLAPPVVDIEKLNAEARAFALEPKEEEVEETEEPQEFYFSNAAPSTPLSTTGQESLKDENKKPTRVPDPKQAFTVGIRNKIIEALRANKNISSEELTLGGHTGFKLTAMSSEKLMDIPEVKEGVLRFGPGVYLVITDNKGERLYFDTKGNVVDKEKGNPVYLTSRSISLNINDKKLRLGVPIVSVEEILEKEIAKGATPEYIAERREQLTKERDEELKQLYDLRKHLLDNPNDLIFLDILGGSKGYFQKGIRDDKNKLNPVPFSEFDFSNEELSTITAATQTTVTQSKGTPYIKLNTLDELIELKANKIDANLISSIAQILTRKITLPGGAIQTNEQKVDYIKQFIYSTGPIYIRYIPGTDEILVKLKGKKIDLPDTNSSEEDIVNTEKEIAGLLTEINPYLTFNNKLKGRNIDIITVRKGQTNIDTKPYIDFVTDNFKVLAEPAADGKVYALNGYISYNIPPSQLDKISGVTKEQIQEEKVKVDEVIKTSEENHPSNNDDEFVFEPLTRAKLLKAGATSEQIDKATKWWSNHPLSKFIPINRMTNIVNSDAWATWTMAGINLYNGSNFTDVYHEAWHAFTQLFLTKEEKLKLYKAVKDSNTTITLANGTKIKSADATNRQVEEYLAEEFRNFSLKEDITKVPKGAKTIFQKILDFLKKWLGGVKVKDVVIQESYIQPVQDLFNHLKFGEGFLNHYTPNINNVMFGSLNLGATAVEDINDKLSYDDSKLFVDSIDSLISIYVDKHNTNTNSKGASARIFSTYANQIGGYNYAKFELKKKLTELTTKYDKLSTENKTTYDGQILTNDIKNLSWVLDNWGDPNSVLSKKQNVGMVYYHRQKSVYKNVLNTVIETPAEKKIRESIEASTAASDAIKSDLNIGDKNSNQYSAKESADFRTLYLVRFLSKVDKKTGKLEFNRLGYPVPTDFSETWNAMVRNLSGSATPQELYNKIVRLQDNFPIFSQLLNKLGNPNDVKDNYEFDMWTGFWQVFKRTNIPIVQMTINKFGIEEEGEVTDYEYLYTIGRTTSNITKVENDWVSEFKQQKPSENKFVSQDNSRNNFLNLEVIMDSFSELSKDKTTRSLTPGSEFEFLRAIGVYLDDKPEIRNEINTTQIENINWIFNAIQHLHKMKNITYNPLKLLKDGFAYTYEVKDKYGKIVRKEPSQRARLEELANIQARYSDNYSNQSANTADNQKVYENSQGNSITERLDAINKAKSFQDLYDENGATPWMNDLDPRRSPRILSSLLLNSVFVLDVDLLHPLFGTKRPGAKVTLENISGIQQTNKGLFFDKGVTSANSDRVTKFTTDFHLLLDSGHQELMRHEAKSASFGLVSKVKANNLGNQKYLYIDTLKFMSPTSLSSVRELINISLNYLKGEILRAGEVRNNPEIYKNYSSYKKGTELTIFDDIIEPGDKEKILSDKFYNDLIDSNYDIIKLLDRPEYIKLRSNLQTQIGTYFDKLSRETQEELEKAEYISPQLYERTLMTSKVNVDNLEDSDYKASLREALIKSYTVNSWINNVESTFVIYGDLVQFNHDKDEFNKRNAMAASTGDMFRTDKAAQNFINNIWGRPYLSNLIKEGKVKPEVASRDYDGTFNTAVVKEVKIRSAYYDTYAKLNIDYYNSLLKKQGIKGKALTEQVNTIVYGKDGTHKKPTGGVMEAYAEMKEADGQGFISFDAYRILKKLEAKWTDSQEKLFQEIIAGKNPSPEEIVHFFPPYKSQYFGPLKTEHLPVTAAHKFSLMPLIPTAIKDSNLQEVHDMMVSQNIDYMTFESGSKLGSVSEAGEPDQLYVGEHENHELNKNLKFTPNVIFLNYLKDQVEINNEFKKKVIFSTQLRKLALQGLYENGKPINAEAKKLADYYAGLVDKLTEYKRKEFLKQAGFVEDKNGNLVGDNADLIRFVQKELKEKGLSDHEIAGLDVDTDTGEAKYDWASSMDQSRLERLVVALVNNRLIKQTMNGENLVQVSNSLFEKPQFKKPTQEELTKYGSNQLPSYHPGKDGKTTAMKVKIAFSKNFNSLLRLKDKEGKSISQYENILQEDGTNKRVVNFDKSLARLNELIRDDAWLDINNNRKKITMVGVRIPVQGLNSMEFMEVYEFLSPSASNILISPSEIVAKSGSDFDIDKLTVFMPRLTSQGDFLETSYSSPDDIEKDIDKLKLEKEAFLKKLGADLSLEDIEKNLKKGVKERREAIKALGSQIGILKEESKQLVDNLRSALATVMDAKNLDEESKQIINYGTDKELIDLVNGLKRSKQLSKISPEANKLSNDSWKLYQDKSEFYEKLNLTKEESEEFFKGQEQADVFTNKISSLNEQKRHFIGTFENQMITSIRNILELPENFITLIRPNGTDIVKSTADELKEFVQEKNHQQSKLEGEAIRKKGISPTRVLEPVFNLDKHQANTVGARGLAISAVTVPANTLGTIIGAHFPATISFEVKKKNVVEIVKKPIKMYLNHNTFDKKGETVISLSDLFDSTNTTRIADTLSQLVNGFLEVGKDAWVAYIQGNEEVIPVLLTLVESGVPFREAAYFVSNPLVREYVKEQRLIKSVLSDPLGTGIEDDSKFRNEAYNRIYSDYFKGYAPQNLALYVKLEDIMTKLGYDKIPMKTLEDIVSKKLPITSNETLAGFLHFIQIENFSKGIKNLRMKTNVDTKKDATLVDAKMREVEIADLYGNQLVTKELIDATLNDTVISSFHIQDFQQKLWGRFFPTTNNAIVNEFLINKLLDKGTRDYAQELTGWDASKISTEFKNNLVSYIFQNYIKAFELGPSDFYKGIKTNEVVPVKYVDQLNSGVLVKDNVIYIDKAQLEKDWSTGAYFRTAGENSYNQQGLAIVPADTFSFKDIESKKEYMNFVIEREYLRYLQPLEKAKEDYLYKHIFTNMRNANPIEEEETQEDYIKRLTKASYEEFLRDQALDNTLNFQKIFYDKDTSMGQQLLSILKDNPKLELDYSVLSQFAVRVQDRPQPGLKGLTNILLKNKRDIDSDLSENYYEQLKKLADPMVKKVDDEVTNNRISSYFRVLPLFAFLQSGMSNNEFSFTNVVPTEDFREIMKEPLKAFDKQLQYKKVTQETAEKLLETKEKYAFKRDPVTKEISMAPIGVLQNFWSKFLHNNSLDNISMRNKFMNYVDEVTPVAILRKQDWTEKTNECGI